MWSTDEHDILTWTCQDMIHVANTLTYNMANDDKTSTKNGKWQLGVACHVVSKQEGWSCIVGQQGYESLWIAYWLICGLKCEP